MQIKTKNHLTPVRMAIILKKTSAGKDVEKLEPLYIVGRSAKWYIHYSKQFLTKLKTELAYSPAIPLLVFIQNN